MGALPLPSEAPVIEAIPTPPAPQPDEALLAGLRAGQSQAYDVLIERFSGPIYRFFYYSHGNHDLAEDQTSETFGNLLQAIHKMRGDAGCLRAFIYGVARNVLRRGWRKQQPPMAGEEALAVLPDHAPSAHERAAERQAYERALLAINSFADPVRQILIMRFVDELPLDEIAEVLELPLGTVKSYIHRGRQRLRVMLGE
jgi:RNA polymerase sigma-70 factor (ECF subfamily)